MSPRRQHRFAYRAGPPRVWTHLLPPTRRSSRQHSRGRARPRSRRRSDSQCREHVVGGAATHFHLTELKASAGWFLNEFARYDIPVAARYRSLGVAWTKDLQGSHSHHLPGRTTSLPTTDPCWRASK